MGFSWRGLAVASAVLAMVLLFAGYRQQMRLFVLAFRGNHDYARVVECRSFGLGLRRIHYELRYNFREAEGQVWSLGQAGDNVPVTYVWGMCCSEHFSVAGDARLRVWELPLLFLGLSSYCRKRANP